MPFAFTATPLPDAFEVVPRIFPDGRGWFFEAYKRSEFHAAGITAEFIQDNQSSSVRGVLRGLHYQRAPHTQAKLVRVLSGAIYDVIVDLRPASPAFGRSFGIELSGENRKMLFVPAGFAHGFATLSDIAEIHYKVDREYNRESESGIRWDDPTLAIDWPPCDGVLSDKDRLLPFFDPANPDYREWSR